MKAEIYTWTHCPFCVRALQILAAHGIECQEHVMDSDPGGLRAVKSRYGHWTVPIILLDGAFIGGCDELEELARAGRLGPAS